MSDWSEAIGETRDFFVSYTHPDESWAEWIGWTLETAGYRVVMQAWDFGPGSHFVAEMHHATQRADRTIAVLSAAYQTSTFASEEWQAAWRKDPTGRDRNLLVVRVEEVSPSGLFAQIVSVDLFGIDRRSAEDRLLAAVRRERRKPVRAPEFPSTSLSTSADDSQSLQVPDVWHIPWPRNPNLVGREDALASVRRGFAADATIGAVSGQVLLGLGGVGKTQLAVEYAYRFGVAYRLVWWVAAEHPTLVVAGLAELAARLGVAVEGRAQASAAAAVNVLRSVGRYRPWLVIADNAGSVSDLCGLLGAVSGYGHLIITSRNPRWAQRARAITVDVLSRAEAVALLRTRAPQLLIADAERLADVLGDLPLAVEQAGTWLATSGMTPAAYLDTVATRTREILAEGRPEGYPISVAATWTIALTKIDEMALGLLYVWAFLGPDAIPLDFMDDDVVAELPGPLAALSDPVLRGRSVAVIVELGLVRLLDGVVVMHRLVQAVLRDHAAGDREKIRSAVAQVLIRAAPDTVDDPASWSRWASLYPHVLAVGMVDSRDERSRQLVLRLCNCLRKVGNYSASRDLAESAHHRWCEVLGNDHRDTIAAAANLASTLRSSGEWVAARDMQRDVLRRRQRLLGDDHQDTVWAAAHLATTLRSLGDLAAAREMQTDVLRRRARLLGDDHLDTITAGAHLATTLRSLGDLEAARAMQRDVLSRRRRLLGEDHPDTLHIVAHLAATLRSLGDLEAARDMQRDVLEHRQCLLGDDHPDTVTATAHLASTLWSLGELVAARELQQDVVERRQRLLGSDHPHSIAATAQLAVWADPDKV